MKNWIIYSTGAILGSVAVAGVSVSAVYYTKYKTTNDGLKDLRAKNNQHLWVDIYSYPSEDATVPTKHKLYEVKNNELTLADLMLDHSDDFSLSAPGGFGRFVNSVFGVTVKKPEFWELVSPSYILQHPDKNGGGPQSKIDGALNVGVSSVTLTENQIFSFYKASF